jgi:hypothetical protein
VVLLSSSISPINTEEEAEYIVFFGLRMVPDVLVTAESEGSLLYDQCAPFAILKPKNRKTHGEMDAPRGAFV